MADFSLILPPIQPTVPQKAAIPFSQAVTTAAAKIKSTDYDCYAVIIESCAFNDSNAARSGVVYVQLLDADGVTYVNAAELNTGEWTVVYVPSSLNVKVITQSGTGHVRGQILQAVKL